MIRICKRCERKSMYMPVWHIKQKKKRCEEYNHKHLNSRKDWQGHYIAQYNWDLMKTQSVMHEA